ncbi:MAG: MBL fold metallo-hydrolase [Acidimicrobiales bacterium]|nr:MBL fold metallo-hydrolase [Acidimicrobiales bacterium]
MSSTPGSVCDPVAMPGERVSIRPTSSRPTPLVAADRVEIISVCDNVTDALLPDQGPARRFRERPGGPRLVDAPLLVGGVASDPPLAQHGYATLVRVTGRGRTWNVLFDTGATPDGCVENLARLGIDTGEIDLVVLSHGHYDHVTGLSGLAPHLGPRHVPVVVHPDAFRSRRISLGDRGHRPLTQLDPDALVAAGFVVEQHAGPTLVADDLVLVTGEVERTTEFERGLPGQEALVDGHWIPDAVMADDQALVVNLDHEGLVVVTGCGHAGVVNITHHARELTGVDHVHAVMGGFHLGGPSNEPAIGPTVAELADLRPDVVVPTHCTGWRAVGAIADALPDAVVHNSVGTTIDLGHTSG